MMFLLGVIVGVIVTGVALIVYGIINFDKDMEGY